MELAFIRINAPHHHLLPLIKLLYENTFPQNERRIWDDFKKLLGIHNMHLNAVSSENNFIGFVIWWNLFDYLFIEHLAIEPVQRSKGYGKKIMQHLIGNSEGRLILETELPNHRHAVKRITFYEKLGLKKLPYSYTQPPYRFYEAGVALQLMSLHDINNKEDFDVLAALIKKEVYEKFW